MVVKNKTALTATVAALLAFAGTAAALTAEEVVGNLGWPLLWVTLALLIAETILARKYSHGDLATAAGERATWASWWRGVTRGGAA